MTPEQASKLRQGDRILVEMRVSKFVSGIVWASYSADILGDERAVFPSAIRKVLPRPLEAGDRVRTADMQSVLVGTILAIDAGQAWVRWPAGDCSISTLANLQRVEDQ